MTRLSIVIPAYNAATTLRMCLRSLETQTLEAPDEYEMVVVDDGSTDGTGALVTGSTWNASVRYIHLPRSERSGRSAARNAGIRAATGDVVVMVDADEIAPPGFLAHHARMHRHRDDLVVIGPRHHLKSPPADLDEFARMVDDGTIVPAVVLDTRAEVLDVFSHDLDNLATRWHYMFSCNVSVPREHLLRVGGFDESFTGWGLEDSELGYRLDRHGLAFAYAPEAMIYHQHPQVIDERMHAEWQRNMALFAAKHASPDVAAQWVIDPAINPAVDHPTWLECCIRFELAVRALHGARPDTFDDPSRAVNGAA